jgi:tRNA/rRNA methyltransferase
MELNNIRVVLVRPRGAANVGSVARSMKNMGLGDLVLVRPPQLRAFWAQAMAVHARDVLERRQTCASLAEAVADCGLVLGTSCRRGPYRAAAVPVREAVPDIVAAAAQGNRVALVFGPEDHGLSNEDLKECQRLISIPSDAAYPSLNLAQAVMICCYEIFLESGRAEARGSNPQPRATAERLGAMFDRLQTAFLKIGFLHPENPDHIMYAMRRMLGESIQDDRDVRIWMALARQIEWCANRHAGAAKQPAGEGSHGAAGEAR